MNNAIRFPKQNTLPDPPQKEKSFGPEVLIPDERGMVDIPFLLLTVLLVMIGLIMVFSASYARAYAEQGKATVYFARQGMFGLAGIGVMLLISRLSYQFWRPLSMPILGGSIALLLLVLIIGTEEGGAKRWIYLGISFQPSELAKVAVIISFAALMSAFREKMETLKYGVLPFAGILAVIAGLLALEPHLSATIIIFGIGGIMMFLGGVKYRWIAGAVIAAALFGVIYLSTMGYASDRIVAWRDPWADQSDSAYQIVQSLYAIGSGGLMGTGLGRGRQKYLYLPEEHNDYIFSIACEELGFVGAVVILLLFALLIIRGFWIAMHAPDRFGALLAGGVMTHIALQVFFNIGVVSNFLPATGISLPFFSYGGTALLVQMFEMGLVLSVSRYSDNRMLA